MFPFPESTHYSRCDIKLTYKNYSQGQELQMAKDGCFSGNTEDKKAGNAPL
jgi:hypothetical protein